MDVLTFLATVIKAVAWPALIGVLAYLFRDALRNSLPNLTQRITALKGWGGEMTFAEGVAKAEQALSDEASETVIPMIAKSNLSEDVRPTDPINKSSPFRVVLDQWDEFDGWLTQVQKRLGMELGSGASADLKLRAVLADASPDPHTSNSFMETFFILQNLKQLALDKPLVVDANDARRFADMMIKFRSWLDNTVGNNDTKSGKT